MVLLHVLLQMVLASLPLPRSCSVVIVSHDGEVFRGREVFHVMPSLAEDFIIGMPKWLNLFITMMIEGGLLSDPRFELSPMVDLIGPWENAPAAGVQLVARHPHSHEAEGSSHQPEAIRECPEGIPGTAEILLQPV